MYGEKISLQLEISKVLSEVHVLEKKKPAGMIPEPTSINRPVREGVFLTIEFKKTFP